MAMNIGSESELQLQAYLRFAKAKRDENVREVDLAFSDVREFKMEDSVYTKDDVKVMINEANEEVKNTVEKELVNNAYVTGVLLKSLFAQAEEGGVELTIDTNKLEDMVLLQDVKAIEKVALSRPASDFVRVPKGPTQRKTLTKVPSMAPEAAVDKLDSARVGQENVQLKREVETLRVKLQGQSMGSMGGQSLGTNNSFGSSVRMNAFESSGAQGQQGVGGGAAAAAAADEEPMGNDVETLRTQLTFARKELAGKLQDSSQFQQMKKMMMQKTKELQAARKKLVAHEGAEKDIRSADVEEDDEFA
mmetsp:Transcript_32363/g.79892  ORF Transcript_32363/g.79892 Transcript_32363/m.79892 type:complete len:305 (+) Transcript_32363:225-1139(+)